MLRRVFWMTVGMATGAWMVLKVQQAASRLTPSGAADQVRRQLHHLRKDLAAAWAEGRRTKRSTETDLRQAARARPAIDVAVRPGLHAARPAEKDPARR